MQRPAEQAIAFPAQIDFFIDQTPRNLARVLAQLAVSGEGALWDSLPVNEKREDMIADLLILYLYAADRFAAEIFGLLSVDGATRDFFFTELSVAARDDLRRLTGGQFSSFLDLLDARRSEYGRCREMVRSHHAPLDGTVMFAFYKHLLAHGRQPAILVMSQVQLDRVESEVMNAFAEVAVATEETSATN